MTSAVVAIIGGLLLAVFARPLSHILPVILGAAPRSSLNRNCPGCSACTAVRRLAFVLLGLVLIAGGIVSLSRA